MIKIKKIFMTLMVSMIVCINSVQADFVHFPPEGCGTMHTFTNWNLMSWSYDSGDLVSFGRKFDLISDSYGIVTYDGFFAGATTMTFGQVGDVLIVVETDGIVYPVIIQDIKRPWECNDWGHYNGADIIEFEILSYMRQTLYGSSGHYISQLINKPIYKIYNIGSIYDGVTYDVMIQKCIEYNLVGYYMLNSPYGGYIIEEL